MSITIWIQRSKCVLLLSLSNMYFISLHVKNMCVEVNFYSIKLFVKRIMLWYTYGDCKLKNDVHACWTGQKYRFLGGGGNCHFLKKISTENKWPIIKWYLQHIHTLSGNVTVMTYTTWTLISYHVHVAFDTKLDTRVCISSKYRLLCWIFWHTIMA